MINIFYGYAIIWTIVLLLYFLGWSDLCTELDPHLLIFIIFSILLSFLIGFINRKKLKFIKLEENPHKKNTVIKILVFLYLIEIIYERKIPLLSVISGISYSDIKFSGIPFFHIIITSFSIFYSFYLSYIFVCFKQKRVLLEYIIIVLYFTLLMQRQNILICLLIFINMVYLGNSSKIKEMRKNKKINILIIVLCILLFYGFGIFGNIRYGDSWTWNDSSMISKLGKMNEKYPSIIPKEYFWSYIYITSPLVNLNYNVKYIASSNNFYDFSMEFIPEFIRNKLFDYEKSEVALPVSSLTASTSYVRVYNNFGYVGMYFMIILQMLLCVIIVNLAYKNKKQYFVTICNALGYFLLFTFFTNTIVYSITAMMVVISILCSTRYTIKKKEQIK